MHGMVTLDQGGGGRPFLRTRKCVGRARDLAELTWIQGRVPVDGGHGWRIVPDTHPHLIHSRTARGTARTCVVGPRSRFIDAMRADRVFTVGVRLLPGTLPALVGETAWELRDRSVAAFEAFGHDGRELGHRLADEPSAERVEEILRGFVVGRVRERRADWRVRGFMTALKTPREAHTGRSTSVRWVAKRLGVSERSLRDVCRAELGLRPKEAHRILRLHHALHLGIAGRSDADAACLAGYTDQAHLIRESHILLGATPPMFRARGRAVLSKAGPQRDR
jgi:AraC-like DNA-binding protein